MARREPSNPFVMATNNETIDYDSVQGRQLWSIATIALREEKFTCSLFDLQSLLLLLYDRANLMGWVEPSGILMITKEGHPGINLITRFREVHIDMLFDHALTVEQPFTRAVQDSEMLYHCLRNSLDNDTNTALDCVATHYMLPGRPSGIIFLNEYIQLCHRTSIRPIMVRIPDHGIANDTRHA